jgi:ATP:corrinoid adenosyltransferase
MPQLLPPTFSNNNSFAERTVFANFQNSHIKDNVFILHSVGLVKHERKKRWAEIDFLVIGPRGILVLEVKGGKIERDSKGYWFTTDKENERNRLSHSPFVQANTGLHAIVKWLDQSLHLDIYNRHIAGSGVLFPNTNKPTGNSSIFGAEAHDDLVSWYEDTQKDMGFIIGKMYSHFEGRHSSGIGLSPGQVKTIVESLRGEFELKISPQWRRDKTTHDQQVLTEQQWETFCSALKHGRVLVHGGAGTGKTILAKKIALRKASAGKKTLLLCFNRKLADKLKEEAVDQNLTVATLHSLAYTTLNNSEGYESLLADIGNLGALSSELLDLFFSHLLDAKDEPYDQIIIDEGQDILESKVIDLLDLLLKGGLKHGGWTWFMDQNLQAGVFGKYDPSEHHRLREYAESIKSLDINCRNTQQIVTLLEQIIPNFEHAVGRITGEKVNIIEAVAKPTEQYLTAEVIRFIQLGLRSDEIVILSPRTLGNSKLKDSLEAEGSGAYFLVPNVGKIQFHTISSFKGLESPGVILVDVDKLDDDWWGAVIYVGITRATYCISLLVTEQFNLEKTQRVGIYYGQQEYN